MTDPMVHLASALQGRYRIERELGAGGMATVYLAHDLRHDRLVAVKVLRPELAALIGSERFLREVRVTAGLQHPHILALFDSGEADGLLYYVMPLVQGESLRARLERETQLPVADAIRIAREVASALDYAHRHGVVHRDIKPENVLLHDGQALVADFGIALAVRAAGGPRLTATGLSLGTPLYMSPEQAAGTRELDARSDVYSLGVLLYEMLAGEPPHTGPTAQAVIASVVADEPHPITARRKTVPPRIAAAIDVALQKLPADRFPSAEAFARALTADAPWSGMAVPAPSRGASGAWIRDWRSWLTLAVAAAALLVALRRGRETPAPSAPAARFRLLLPGLNTAGGTAPAGVVTAPVISPDGTVLIYPAVTRDSAGANRRLFLRPLGQVEAVPIPGTEGADAPFFSPDSRWIGFWLGPRLVKVPVAGGVPSTLADSTSPFIPGASWGPDGKVVFTAARDALAEVDENGGTPRVIYRDSTKILGGPIVLPDGQGILFLRCRSDVCGQRQEIAILNPASHAVGVVTAPDAFKMAPVLWDGYLLYVRGGLYVTADADLFAAPFDIRRGLTGEAVRVLEHVRSFTLSRTGTLVTAESPGSRRQLVVVAMDGAERPLTDLGREYLFPAVSPDGRRVAVEIHDAVGGQIWVYDVASKSLARLTALGHNSRPVWSPDGARIAYSSARDTASAIYLIPADGSGTERRVGLADPAMAFADLTWTPDGRRIAYSTNGTGDRVFELVATDSGDRPIPFLSPGTGRPVFSPDARWVAYASGESGRLEVYVRPYPGPGGRWLISADGGGTPVWEPSGRTLFYLGSDGWLYAATLALGREVQVVRRARLFDARRYLSDIGYDVFPDGRHFLFIREDQSAPEVNVTINWITELSQRLRPGRPAGTR